MPKTPDERYTTIKDAVDNWENKMEKLMDTMYRGVSVTLALPDQIPEGTVKRLLVKRYEDAGWIIVFTSGSGGGTLVEVGKK